MSERTCISKMILHPGGPFLILLHAHDYVVINQQIPMKARFAAADILWRLAYIVRRDR
jgi:hypothetical protein